jgi:hypothetical protein
LYEGNENTKHQNLSLKQEPKCLTLRCTKTILKMRHSNHKREIKNKIGGLGYHYGGEQGCDYNNFSVRIIDKVEEGNVEALALCEQYWQDLLREFVENGGNVHCRRKEK